MFSLTGIFFAVFPVPWVPCSVYDDFVVHLAPQKGDCSQGGGSGEGVRGREEEEEEERRIGEEGGREGGEGVVSYPLSSPPLHAASDIDFCFIELITQTREGLGRLCR